MIKRWFDDLWGLERSMDESSPLPNLKLQKVGNSGPWLHRLLVLSTIFLTIFYQEKKKSSRGLFRWVLKRETHITVETLTFMDPWGSPQLLVIKETTLPEKVEKWRFLNGKHEKTCAKYLLS